VELCEEKRPNLNTSTPKPATSPGGR
jgi:hypothetical protein